MDPALLGELPPEVLARFRAVSFERLERMDASWRRLLERRASPGDGETVARELHALKGDARVTGFADAGGLCERLEALVEAARARGFQVPREADVVATMAVHLLATLILRRPGTSGGGVDLGGVSRHLEAAKLWLEGEPEGAGPPSAPRRGRPVLQAAAPEEGGAHVGGLAVEAYLEHLRGTGAARERLRGVFEAMAGVARELDPGSPAPAPLEVHCFEAARSPCLVAVDAAWDVEEGRDPPACCVSDVLSLPADASVGSPWVVLDLHRRHDGVRVSLSARGLPVPAVASPICPTPRDAAVTVVRIADRDALLVRPETWEIARART